MNKNIVNEFYASWSRGTALYSAWAARHGVSYTELTVLYTLVINQATTQKRICEHYGLPKQTINHCIRDLVSKGYLTLTAGEQDKREKQISLTPEGQTAAQHILTPLFDIEAYICRNIDSKRFVQAIETRELFNTLFEQAMKKEASI